MLIRNTYFFNILKIRRIFREIIGVHDCLYREFHVICRKRLAVMPLDSVSYMKSICKCFLIIVIAFRKPCHNMVVLVITHKTVKYKLCYLCMLIHCRIDACIVIRAVDKHLAITAACCVFLCHSFCITVPSRSCSRITVFCKVRDFICRAV